MGYAMAKKRLCNEQNHIEANLLDPTLKNTKAILVCTKIAFEVYGNERGGALILLLVPEEVLL